MMKRKRYVIIIAVLAAIFSVSTFFLIRDHIDSNIGTEKSVDTCRDCGYYIRLYLFLDHKTGGICGQ